MGVDDKLKEAFELYLQEEEPRLERMEQEAASMTFSKDFERRMNKLFRELGIDEIPHPEAEEPLP